MKKTKKVMITWNDAFQHGPHVDTDSTYKKLDEKNLENL